ncbi:ABC transporter permease [Streptomyces mobaraensis NBRC 13819 = DSM 40847]|uniref:BldKC, ABC transporter integral membrane protein n=1 Tax=Streptomyces mobaraensis (strain ATCC 29032 / DSM 40847 / JCM 4168 / NBRC 13819 / NCIMB 11159 / IPCR 16-22) TaxID=1223523 RepID=M3BYD1_STRM1|nr:ABC transporter permease [Streptomyces mobaraensis]EME96770.1 BldKC, ABC transporter integral membrane protein [Streptomyces mobaraensis NBRC 13819 = DSM 40847]QTT75523.1 ABC transporter permease [Streptomyces mobaraensis NBRC 13819 = DSM 40847]
MLRFLLRRFLGAIVIVLLISAITFFLFFALPSEPALMSCGKNCTPDALAVINKNLGLDEPVPVQYWHYMTGIFTGRDFSVGHCPAPCLGYSFSNQQPVWDTIVDRFPTTLSIALGGAVVFLVVGVGIGMIAAAFRGTWIDKFFSSLSLIGNSLQIYFVGVVALAVFVSGLHWFDNPAYYPITEDPVKWFTGMIIPWLVLSIIFIANYSRMTRSQMIEQLAEDHVRTARAKGLGRRTVFFRYAWRGAMTPIVTLFGIDLGSLFGGAIVTEFTFSLHGLGRLAVSSVSETDLPTLMAVMLVACTAIVVANIVVDAAYAVIDPRVRLG